MSDKRHNPSDPVHTLVEEAERQHAFHGQISSAPACVTEGYDGLQWAAVSVNDTYAWHLTRGLRWDGSVPVSPEMVSMMCPVSVPRDQIARILPCMPRAYWPRVCLCCLRDGLNACTCQGCNQVVAAEDLLDCTMHCDACRAKNGHPPMRRAADSDSQARSFPWR